MANQITTGLLDVLQNIAESEQDSGNAPVMMMLGDFQFSINTAVFDRIEKSSEYRWATVERTGDLNDLQFTGIGDVSMTLPGVVYPGARGGTGQISSLQLIAQQGQPQRLITGAGAIVGYWVITSVRETQSFFNPDGSFRKQEFTVALKYYGPDLS